jgi:hypothetical protein
MRRPLSIHEKHCHEILIMKGKALHSALFTWNLKGNGSLLACKHAFMIAYIFHWKARLLKLHNDPITYHGPNIWLCLPLAMPTIICIFIRVKHCRNDIHMWRQLKGFKHIFWGGKGGGGRQGQLEFVFHESYGWMVFVFYVSTLVATFWRNISCWVELQGLGIIHCNHQASELSWGQR